MYNPDIASRLFAYEEGELGEEEQVLELFADLIKSGWAWQLQGRYGRMARDLIEGGWISEDGEVLVSPRGPFSARTSYLMLVGERHPWVTFLSVVTPLLSSAISIAPPGGLHTWLVCLTSHITSARAGLYFGRYRFGARLLWLTFVARTVLPSPAVSRPFHAAGRVATTTTVTHSSSRDPRRPLLPARGPSGFFLFHCHPRAGA